MYIKKIPEDLDCGITITMKVLGGKWKACIMDCIHRGVKRPSEIHRNINAAVPRVINMQLNELEAQGIVSKKIFHGLPLKVEYSLTPIGLSLMPIVKSIDQWGIENREVLESVKEPPVVEHTSV